MHLYTLFMSNIEPINLITKAKHHLIHHKPIIT
jgi:hypothetical protein